MDIDVNRYKMVQLRRWCLTLGLPSSGTKAALAMRLNTVPFAERGDPPAVNSVANQENVTIDEEEEQELADENEIVVVSSDVHTDAGNIETELNLLKRERDLLVREISLLKKKGETTGEGENTAKIVMDADAGHPIPLNIIKDMIPEYDGGSHFNFWEAQVRSLVEIHKVNETTMRALITIKLSGKALKWLRSNLICATCNFEDLLCLMKSTFGSCENKLVRRKNFEERKWASGETFSEYYSEKTIMAAGLHIDK